MSAINISNATNIVSFCERSLDLEAMDLMIRANKGIGLSDPFLEDNLKRGDYRAVLVSVWSERDRPRRLAWLESKSNELHPVLMFELSVAKFVASPTAETVNSFSVPLIQAAAFRVTQDAQCAKDVSVKNGDAAIRMSTTYARRLHRQVEATLQRSLPQVLSDHQDARIAAIKEKVLTTAQLSQRQDLPSPDWIGWHGLSVFIQGKPNMHPAGEYKQIRNAYASEVIEKLKM